MTRRRLTWADVPVRGLALMVGAGLLAELVEPALSREAVALLSLVVFPLAGLAYLIWWD